VRSSRCHNLAAALGRHAGAKAVTALAHQFARLVGPFHEVVSADALEIGLFAPISGVQARNWRGLYETPPAPSMQCCRGQAALACLFDSQLQSAGRFFCVVLLRAKVYEKKVYRLSVRRRRL
jgi:hypothetical protein